MVCLAVVAVLVLSAIGAHAQVLIEDDFERGLSADWEVRSGQWEVVEDPHAAGNHVLRLSGSGGQITRGNEEWSNVRLSVRVRIETAAPLYHVKLGLRAERPDRSYFINLRSDGPIVVFQDGAQFTQLGRVGELDLRPGRWYRAELEASGPFLTAKAWIEGEADSEIEARFYEPSIERGAILLTLWMPEGEAQVFFDDVVVTEVPAPSEPAAGRVHTIRNELVEVAFDESTARFSITDRRTSRRWSQPIQAALLSVSDVESTSTSLAYRLQSPAGPVRVRLELEASAELLVTIEPDGKGRHADLSYPDVIEPPDPSAELVIPTDEGMIVSVTSGDFPRIVGAYHHGQGGWLMPWCGMLMGDEGIMMLVETPDDFRGRVDRLRAEGNELMGVAVTWLASLDDLRYPRRLRYCLFDEGGYMAMAKRYRQHLVDIGRFRTLAEKAEEIPDVAKLIGAINILDRSRDESTLDWMISHGIRRALYSCGGPRERVEKAKDAGYVVNRYDIYTDVAGPELLEVWGPPRSDKDQRRIGFPEECYICRDGTPRPGFPYPVGARGGVDPAGREGKRIRCYKRCAAPQLRWMQAIIPEQIEQYGYTARFIDVETAHPLYECYSDQHPATRTQDRENRIKLFDYLRSLGQVCSSEGGGDWPAHALHYQEGSLTLTRFGYIPGVYVGTGPFDVPEEYVRNQLNMAIRVPLHKLVYHDSVLMTWRWNHTPNRWRQPDRWDDWDLLHLLYGGMPIFVVDEDNIGEKGERVLQSYHTICDFTEKVGGHEMVSHRFLTPDRMVQETRFANGHGVIVNFSQDKPFECEQGTIEPRSFALLEE